MITSLDITALAAGYESKAFTTVDVINHVYERIAAQGDSHVWISLRSRDEALSRATAAPKGPLYGMPFAVKDNIDVAGLSTTCACPAFAYMPERSARVIELLEAAGAIVIGKTNMDQFATSARGRLMACQSIPSTKIIFQAAQVRAQRSLLQAAAFRSRLARIRLDRAACQRASTTSSG
jgi:Asp-tRNA(Asn)/Glu-tRNA(Gln) amidotransferase A subunit family amidase